MGKFWGMIKKVGCKIGVHSGAWEYQSPDQCLQLRICELCGTESKREEHVWGKWDYLYDRDCRQLCLCHRCGEEKVRTEHQWGPWRYKSLDSCLQVRICDRCLETEEGSAKHIFDLREFVDREKCMQVEVCSRCGQKGSGSYLTHDWGEWKYRANENTPIRLCRRCGETEEKAKIEP